MTIWIYIYKVISFPDYLGHFIRVYYPYPLKHTCNCKNRDKDEKKD